MMMMLGSRLRARLEDEGRETDRRGGAKTRHGTGADWRGGKKHKQVGMCPYVCMRCGYVCVTVRVDGEQSRMEVYFGRVTSREGNKHMLHAMCVPMSLYL